MRKRILTRHSSYVHQVLTRRFHALSERRLMRQHTTKSRSRRGPAGTTRFSASRLPCTAQPEIDRQIKWFLSIYRSIYLSDSDLLSVCVYLSIYHSTRASPCTISFTPSVVTGRFFCFGTSVPATRELLRTPVWRTPHGRLSHTQRLRRERA